MNKIKQSVLGIISITSALIPALVILGIQLINLLGPDGKGETLTRNIYIELSFYAVLIAFPLIAFILAIISLLRHEKLKIFAILGLILSSLQLLPLLFIYFLNTK